MDNMLKTLNKMFGDEFVWIRGHVNDYALAINTRRIFSVRKWEFLDDNKDLMLAKVIDINLKLRGLK